MRNLALILTFLVAISAVSAAIVTSGDNNSSNPYISGNWAAGVALEVGVDGSGSLDVDDGFEVTNTLGTIGKNNGSTGTVTISGTNSLWQNNSSLYVGRFGAGILNITSGGKVTSGSSFVGYYAGGSGTVTVTGADSLWEDASTIEIGINGTLNISSGGLVTALSANIADGGVLSGDSTLRLNAGAGMLTASGTIKPGNSIGTLNVDGDVTFESSSVLEIEVDNSGNSDVLAITGDATINGGTVKAISDGGVTITETQEYTFLTAASVTGTFDTLNTALLVLDAYIDAASSVGLEYGPTNVKLTIRALDFDDPTIVQTSNQNSIGAALQEIADGGGNDITSELQGLATNGELLAAYGTLMPQAAMAGPQVTLGASRQFSQSVFGRIANVQQARNYAILDKSSPEKMLASLDGETLPFVDSGAESQWRPFVEGFGQWADQESQSDLFGYQYDTYGMTVGFDKFVEKNVLVGVSVATSTSNVNFADSSGLDVESLFTSIYGSVFQDNWHFDFSAGYGYNWYESERNVLVGAISRTAKADYDGQLWNADVQAGYAFRQENLTVEPIVGMGYSNLKTDSYTEKGAGTANLTIDSDTTDSFYTKLGLKITTLIESGNDFAKIIPELRIFWLHDYTDKTTMNSTFSSGAQFDTSGYDVAKDRINLGLGVNIFTKDNVRFFVNYDAEFSSNLTSHAASVGLQWTF